MLNNKNKVQTYLETHKYIGPYTVESYRKYGCDCRTALGSPRYVTYNDLVKYII